jgi:hypothetical protein
MNESTDNAIETNDTAGETDSIGREPPETAVDPFATYLANYYVGRKGFSLGTVPEAKALADACDIVLTQLDGMTLRVICIEPDRPRVPQVFWLG